MRQERVPLREDLFTEDAEGGALLASRCKFCGRSFSPKGGIV